jgi:1,4-alpha-glucan branching enzyme
MTRNQYGVYEVLVKPLSNGKVAIPHGSKVKVWKNREK